MIYGAWSGVVGLLFFVAFTVVLRFGADLVERQQMSSGDLISFVLYTVSLSGSVAMLGSIMPAFSAAVGATQKIFEITERRSMQVEGQLDPQECRGHLEFEKVCFHYATRESLRWRRRPPSLGLSLARSCLTPILEGKRHVVHPKSVS